MVIGVEAVNPILKTETEAHRSELASPGPTFDNEAADSLVFSCYHNASSKYY